LNISTFTARLSYLSGFIDFMQGIVWRCHIEISSVHNEENRTGDGDSTEAVDYVETSHCSNTS
jgi:hypothetical protein